MKEMTITREQLKAMYSMSYEEYNRNIKYNAARAMNGESKFEIMEGSKYGQCRKDS